MLQVWSSIVDEAVQSGKKITHSYKLQPDDTNLRASIKLLDNGCIYIKADMDADADGSPDAITHDPGNGQFQTSLSKHNGWKGDSQYVNSETIPYFVLPLNFKSVCGVDCKLGDLALIRWKDREIFAIFADEGPKVLIGEGSIKTIEALGESPWNSSKTRIIKGIPFGVEYLVFPQSTATIPIPSSFDEIQTVGLEIFHQVFDLALQYSMTFEDMQEHSQPEDIEIWEIINAPQFKTLVDLNCRRGVGRDFSIVTVIPANTIVKNRVGPVSEDPVSGSKRIYNVGTVDKGLWFKVEHKDKQGFVRASTKYLLPDYSEDV